MALTEIFCQDNAVNFLQRAYATGRLPHALVFAGPEGVGKFTTAREWAKVLLCYEPRRDDGFVDSCGRCQSCRLFESGSHPDYHHVYRELVYFTSEGRYKKTPPVDLPIDVVREFLIDRVASRPSLSQRRVFVVDQAEKLSTAAQNSMLKVLEEPPTYCTIILLCTQTEPLLPTIRSRCQLVRFGPVCRQKIVEKLNQMGLEDAQCQYWARLCQGSIGRACRWAALELAGAELYATKKQLVESLAKYRYRDALKFAQWCIEKTRRLAAAWTELEPDTSRTDVNRRAQKTIINIIISALHDAMRWNADNTAALVNLDQSRQIESLGRRYTCEQAAESISRCHRTLRFIDASVNEKLLFEQLLLRLADADIMRV